MFDTIKPVNGMTQDKEFIDETYVPEVEEGSIELEKNVGKDVIVDGKARGLSGGDRELLRFAQNGNEGKEAAEADMASGLQAEAEKSGRKVNPGDKLQIDHNKVGLKQVVSKGETLQSVLDRLMTKKDRMIRENDLGANIYSEFLVNLNMDRKFYTDNKEIK